MKRSQRVAEAGIVIMAVAMIFLTGCTTEKEREAARQYREEAEAYMEEEKYEQAQEAMKQALEQTPEDEELLAASEEMNQKINQRIDEINAYNATMEAARQAIEADDAAALDALQESDAGKALVKAAQETGSYIYMPEGGTSGKGIGFYTFNDCDCDQWYYGDYQEGSREGNGIWYFVSSHTEDKSL